MHTHTHTHTHTRIESHTHSHTRRQTHKHTRRQSPDREVNRHTQTHTQENEKEKQREETDVRERDTKRRTIFTHSTNGPSAVISTRRRGIGCGKSTGTVTIHETLTHRDRERDRERGIERDVERERQHQVHTTHARTTIMVLMNGYVVYVCACVCVCVCVVYVCACVCVCVCVCMCLCVCPAGYQARTITSPCIECPSRSASIVFTVVVSSLILAALIFMYWVVLRTDRGNILEAKQLDHVCACERIHTYLCMCVYVHMCASMHVCMWYIVRAFGCAYTYTRS